MIIEPHTPVASAPAPSKTEPQGKPLSASCCHALAAVAALGGVGAVLAAFLGTLAPEWFMRGPVVVISAVGWWALGDIVAALDRIAQRSV